MGALFLHLKPDEYLKKLYKTKKLVEKTSFSLQAEIACTKQAIFFYYFPMNCCVQMLPDST
ncbi:hypothetical protein CJZ71_20270 [Bacillus subtilis]|nr:hypothetical protein A4A60_08115 [Bacillus subtilis]ARW31198.1 hypothetical protein S101441_01649 [Bacillus subtilis subsp. subtilis]ASV04269.1 hypothetical protein CJZ71_20270 [Bacillus subtilis]AYK56726.1 hypothetical protein D9C10_05790 [Bacillus subtilis subsp. subtilis]AYK70356.1 hypothetical protein D9C09_11715 [Bacillus subtilis subsp. subtilis]